MNRNTHRKNAIARACAAGGLGLVGLLAVSAPAMAAETAAPAGSHVSWTRGTDVTITNHTGADLQRGTGDGMTAFPNGTSFHGHEGYSWLGLPTGVVTDVQFSGDSNDSDQLTFLNPPIGHPYLAVFDRGEFATTSTTFYTDGQTQTVPLRDGHTATVHEQENDSDKVWTVDLH